MRTYLCTNVQPYKSFQITSKNEKYYKLKIKKFRKEIEVLKGKKIQREKQSVSPTYKNKHLFLKFYLQKYIY